MKRPRFFNSWLLVFLLSVAALGQTRFPSFEKQVGKKVTIERKTALALLRIVRKDGTPIPPSLSEQVNAAIVDPGFIVKVRKKLALDQREAAEIFGGGINAFSRYENGKTKPPLALVKLLKVLDRHPDLLSEVRAA